MWLTLPLSLLGTWPASLQAGSQSTDPHKPGQECMKYLYGFLHLFFLNIFLLSPIRDMFIDFRQRGRGRERERNIDVREKH